MNWQDFKTSYDLTLFHHLQEFLEQWASVECDPKTEQILVLGENAGWHKKNGHHLNLNNLWNNQSILFIFQLYQVELMF